VPALHQLPTQPSIGWLEVQQHVEATRSLERAIDQIQGSVRREDEDDALVDLDAIHRGQENGLILGFATVSRSRRARSMSSKKMIPRRER